MSLSGPRTAGLFALGIYELLIALLGVAAGEPPAVLGAQQLVVLLQLLAATIAGLAAAFLLAERDGEARVS